MFSMANHFRKNPGDVGLGARYGRMLCPQKRTRFQLIRALVELGTCEGEREPSKPLVRNLPNQYRGIKAESMPPLR
jgi:hypothetical protein